MNVQALKPEIRPLLRPVDPRNLHDYWMFVRQGLLQCITKGGGRYLPEDVYHLLRIGSLALFLIGEDRNLGFVILRREDEPSGAVLFVYALWLPSGAGEELEAALYKALDAKAYEIGAKRHKMHSSRKGWERCGWEATQTIYEREVSHGR